MLPPHGAWVTQTTQHRILTLCDGLERRSIPVYHRFMHIAHDTFMSKVSAFFRPAVDQSGMYIRSRMSSHLSLNVVYLRVCQRLTSYLTRLKTAETIYIYYASPMHIIVYVTMENNSKGEKEVETVDR